MRPPNFTTVMSLRSDFTVRASIRLPDASSIGDTLGASRGTGTELLSLNPHGHGSRVDLLDDTTAPFRGSGFEDSAVAIVAVIVEHAGITTHETGVEHVVPLAIEAVEHRVTERVPPLTQTGLEVPVVGPVLVGTRRLDELFAIVGQEPQAGCNVLDIETGLPVAYLIVIELVPVVQLGPVAIQPGSVPV